MEAVRDFQILEVYDNKGETFDRYSVVFNFIEKVRNGETFYQALGLSDNPDSPLGYSEFGAAILGEHLGDKIKFDELPANVRRHVINRLS